MVQSSNCFKVLDTANTTIQLKTKKILYIHWERPSLNQQLYNVNLKFHLVHKFNLPLCYLHLFINIELHFNFTCFTEDV